MKNKIYLLVFIIGGCTAVMFNKQATIDIDDNGRNYEPKPQLNININDTLINKPDSLKRRP